MIQPAVHPEAGDPRRPASPPSPQLRKWPRRADQRLLLSLLPHAGDWTDEDYLWLTRDTLQLIELADGQLEVLPMPTVTHQLILKRLLLALDAFIHFHGGILLFAPLKLRLAPGRFREPDLLALCDRGDPRMGEQYWTGADLVIEILSPGNRDHDLATKRAEYAAAAIPEYWLVDPDQRLITVLTLADDAYAERGRFAPGQTLTSTLLPELAVDVAAVLAR